MTMFGTSKSIISEDAAAKNYSRIAWYFGLVMCLLLYLSLRQLYSIQQKEFSRGQLAIDLAVQASYSVVL